MLYFVSSILSVCWVLKKMKPDFIKAIISITMLLFCAASFPESHTLTPPPNYYCTGDQCPQKPPGTLNNEYPGSVCAKEYRCQGNYLEKIVAERCGCCACHEGTAGCAGGYILCRDGTLSQVCRCQYRLSD